MSQQFDLNWLNHTVLDQRPQRAAQMGLRFQRPTSQCQQMSSPQVVVVVRPQPTVRVLQPVYYRVPVFVGYHPITGQPVYQ